MKYKFNSYQKFGFSKSKFAVSSIVSQQMGRCKQAAVSLSVTAYSI